MKKVLAAALILLAFSACSPKAENPVVTAIKVKVTEKMDGDVTSIKVTDLQKVDSVDFQTEISHRIAHFNLKLDQELKLCEKYIREGKSRNAALKQASIDNDVRIINGLREIEAAMGDAGKDVAYYYYTFMVKASGAETKLEMPLAYAVVTPDNQVIAIADSKKAVSKVTGKTIPGYLDLLQGEADEE